MGTHRRIDNSAARRLFLDRHGLIAPPFHKDLPGLIHDLGFVQVDSVNTLARAHDLILWSRRQAYRPAHMDRMLKQRRVFEHWTHDASVVPMEFFPQWRLKFARDKARCDSNWDKWRREGFREKFGTVLEQIAAHGPVTSAQVGEDEAKGSQGWWDWHPSKAALEYLWRAGELSVTRREGFRKVYDLTERVIPPEILARQMDQAEIIDWACTAALDRLGFATSGELAAFFDLVTPAEAKDWTAAALAAGRVEQVEVGNADGSWRKSVCWPGAADGPEPGGRVRVLSPFDPALRDRKRAERLFGFHYRIEIFVPEAKRQYGYYVFPVLEGTRLIGRIDMRRTEGCLTVRAFWSEPGARLGKGRRARLEAELERLARMGQCTAIQYAADWQRGPLG